MNTTTTTTPRKKRGADLIARLDREAAERAKNFKPPQFSYGPNLLDIQCGQCGYQADAQEFTTTRLGQTRPIDEIQCPRCNMAVRRTAKDGNVKLVPIQATL